MTPQPHALRKVALFSRHPVEQQFSVGATIDLARVRPPIPIGIPRAPRVRSLRRFFLRTPRVSQNAGHDFIQSFHVVSLCRAGAAI